MTEVGIVVQRQLDATTITHIIELMHACSDTDGTAPFSEHVLLHLRHGGDFDVRHLLAYESARLVGYAHLDLTDEVAGPSAEIAVLPDMRRGGVGRALLSALVAESADKPLRLWAHGESAAAASLARTHGFAQVRTLWQMRRSLLAALPEVVLPDDISLRSFDPASDSEAWLACNNAAFAHHPEQGRWTEQHLRARMAEPWFDVNGFLIAHNGAGEMVGFSWTKVHGAMTGEDPMGEIYVVGVLPQWQGKKLGKALTVAGLKALRQHNLTSTMLYVDSADQRAIALYERLGFVRWDSDTLFQQPTG